jgi:hypothetical protein
MTSPTEVEVDLRKVNFLKGEEEAFHFEVLDSVSFQDSVLLLQDVRDVFL